MEKNLTFKLVRETKGTFVFQELKEGTEEIAKLEEMAIGTLYIRKSALNPEEKPQKVEITLKTI